MPTMDWEYKTFRLSWEPEEIGWVGAYHYNEVAAKAYYWQNYQSSILPALQRLLDEGWEPITEVGPAAIRLNYYRAYDNPIADSITAILALIVGLTIVLIPIALLMAPDKPWKYKMTSFQVELRRARTPPRSS